ncbi:MAG TPA: pyridine nucleotide-disulfide oxidoreductase, partial [Clostridia bacterium]|nr:pyridine nucleotide-disulfide oxidoreductase [Clostridia bacterium]
VPVSDVPATKAGIFAHYQAEVVARNIARLIRGQEPTFRYKGKGT